MRTNYEAPQVEIIEIELEGILCTSGEPSSVEGIAAPRVENGGSAW